MKRFINQKVIEKGMNEEEKAKKMKNQSHNMQNGQAKRK